MKIEVNGFITWIMRRKEYVATSNRKWYHSATMVVRDSDNQAYPFYLLGKWYSETQGLKEGDEITICFTLECKQKGGQFWPYYKPVFIIQQ